MLRPQKLAKGPLKAFKGKGEKCGIEAVSSLRLAPPALPDFLLAWENWHVFSFLDPEELRPASE
ncbi:Uncharacterised protein [Escherichia coli]|nr:hypothetical protein CCE17_18445 [Escherichia coli]PJW88126.1 hypothetical protein CWD62_19620 [Escherichia coli]RCB62975.1 hypothetical protein C6A67_18485 [Escherichia coli]RCB76077.1 hypothetical protein C6A80_19235 [Escherichia coli]RDA06161.1 hypothetical protein DTM16_20930 [Escherichia coli]